jgi:hypothetical protein
MTMITYTTIGKLIVISLAVQIILVINLAPALTCMDLALRVRIAVSISCGLVMLVCLFTGSLVRTPWYKCKREYLHGRGGACRLTGRNRQGY